MSVPTASVRNSCDGGPDNHRSTIFRPMVTGVGKYGFWAAAVATCHSATQQANTSHLPPNSAARLPRLTVVVIGCGLRPTS